MKSIEVVAAIIKEDNEILATQRGYGDFRGKWEFPGGKIEPGETPEEALVREIREELDTTIEIDRFVYTVRYKYPDFHLTMHCYLCNMTDGSPTMLEHSDSKWVDRNTIDCLDWLPADIEVVDALKKQGVV